MERQPGRGFDAVGFVVLDFREIGVSRFHDDVARCAGAAPAARMFQMQSIVQRNIQQRALQPVFRIRHGVRIVIDRDIGWQKRNFWHFPLEYRRGEGDAAGKFLDMFDRVWYDWRDFMDSHSRSVAKAVSYRVFGSLSTALIFYFLTGDLKTSAGAGIADSVMKLGLYFLHERVWNHINFGRQKPPEYEI